MAHLTDKPMGLQKMMRELKVVQEALALANRQVEDLVDENNKLQLEIRQLNLALSKKNRRRTSEGQ